jgi:16S rRNA (guanine527-N7)-methyltransferase
MTPGEVSSVLTELRIIVSDRQSEQIASYTSLLLRWNQAISLTAVREPSEILVRHFAESLCVMNSVSLQGALLDVGSGAGFPGLALKIAVPDLRVVLLEPVAKKRAFLKEVVRECGLSQVEVRPERVEGFSASHPAQFEAATARAVGDFASVLPAIGRCLNKAGSVYLWLTKREIAKLADTLEFSRVFDWSKPVPIPRSRERAIWRGQLKHS